MMMHFIGSSPVGLLSGMIHDSITQVTYRVKGYLRPPSPSVRAHITTEIYTGFKEL